MIIWGTRGITSTIQSDRFHCPRCSTQTRCSLKQVRNFFTLYFIPLIPLNVAGKYVECETCGGTYSEAIMSHDPEKERQETQIQLLRIMILAALADGDVDQSERSEINKQYMELAGLPLPAATLDQEIALAREAQTDLNTFVGQMVGDLSPHGKAHGGETCLSYDVGNWGPSPRTSKSTRQTRGYPGHSP